MRIGIYQSYWGWVGGGQRYLGVVAELLARDHEVDIIHHHPDFHPSAVEEPLQIDLSRIRFRYVLRTDRPCWTTINPFVRLRDERTWMREISAGYDLYIDSSDNAPYFCHARRGVLLTHFPLVTFEQFHGHTTEQWQTMSIPARFLRHLYHRLEWRRRMATYDLCIVNSAYTRHWTKRLWGMDSHILYPPMRSGLTPKSKEAMILTIGAFHHQQHKKQDTLLTAFRGLCEHGLKGWRLLFVGACRQDEQDLACVDRLRRLGAGLPIEVRTNVSGNVLNNLLGRASLLWHSMGYGVDPDKQPQLLEHFGMIAPEAMAAGCVPVVFDGGGLREIVEHGRTGYRWSDLEQLHNQTLSLTRDPDLRQCMSEAATHSAARFSKHAFEQGLYELLAPVLR